MLHIYENDKRNEMWGEEEAATIASFGDALSGVVSNQLVWSGVTYLKAFLDPIEITFHNYYAF